MAVITDSTFDPLLAHVNVRLQQGVPIVDADWNTQDDIRKFELRAFLKWYVGDGAPDQNDGFRIAAGTTNSFVVKAGVQGPAGSLTNQETALRQVGRFIVDGLDVFLRSDVAFDQQPLHESQPGAAALAARLGVPVITALQSPPGDQTVVVELDVWERLLTPDEEPRLIHPALGVETCSRTRREWVVRAYPSTAIGARLAGHSYATLATLQRFANQTGIADGQITDRRQRKLLVPPASLVTDMLGVDPYDYRAGQGRPPISLRAAVNALLAGQLPATPDLAVSPASQPDTISRSVLLDAQNGLTAFWTSQRLSNVDQVHVSRMDLAAPTAFSAAVAITGSGAHSAPAAVALPNGEFVVAYQAGGTGIASTDVKMKRGSLSTLAGATEVDVAKSAGADESPVAVLTGDVVTFFTRQDSSDLWQFRRYRHTDNTFLDDSPVSFPTGTGPGMSGGMHAVAAGGMVWFAFVAGNTTSTMLGRFNPAAPAASAVDHFITTALAGNEPYVVAISATEAMVFYKDNQIKTVTATGGSWVITSPVPITGTENDRHPAAVRDADGTVFLLADRVVTGTNNEIFLRRRDPANLAWGAAQLVIAGPAGDQQPQPVLVPGQGMWVLWSSDRPGTSTGNFDLYAKHIITTI
ncbi:DUF6519 domain-containing protein [Winogradskya humida]|uniref:Uncharacterized protein n=1 Tax=Winogradskya humida TaxID=113566 RepID=A0ABQ3ZYI2_9ACTN|nr:DUF6519 domain-containing protein [Actinoplanes humidus]GIE23639.1 hypothetical protein Ahu01nite_067410 [Actinoplanes humidus]